MLMPNSTFASPVPSPNFVYSKFPVWIRSKAHEITKSSEHRRQVEGISSAPRRSIRRPEKSLSPRPRDARACAYWKRDCGRSHRQNLSGLQCWAFARGLRALYAEDVGSGGDG